MKEPEYRILAEFRQNLRKFLHFSQEAARDAGIEAQQYQMMLAIKGLPADVRPTIGELAKRMYIQHHSCVGLVDRLAERGLVKRVRDPDDRRRIIVRLTSRGESTLRKLYKTHAAELRRLAPELIETLSELLASASDAAA